MFMPPYGGVNFPYKTNLNWIIEQIRSLQATTGSLEQAWEEFQKNFGSELDQTVKEQLTVWLNDGTLANMLLFTQLKVGHLGSNEGVLLGGLSFPNDPDMGLLLSTDGNTSWGIIQSQKAGSKTEVTIQSKIYLGVCNVKNGVVTRVEGTVFNPGLPLKHIWIDNTKYEIDHYTSGNELILTDTSVNKESVFYQFINEYAVGIVNTNGKTVTYVSGDQFAYWWAGENIVIDNTTYTIDSVSLDGRTIELTSIAPTANNVQFLYESQLSNDVATLGINKMSGRDEERLVVTAKAYGEYRISTVATGRGKHFPLAIDTFNSQAVYIDESNVEIDRNLALKTKQGNNQIQLTGTSENSYLIVDKNTDSFTLYQDSGGNVFYAYPTTKQIKFNYLLVMPEYNQADLPANAVRGSIAWCIDVASMVVYDGSAWQKITGTPL